MEADKMIEIALSVVGGLWAFGTTMYLYRNRIPKVKLGISTHHVDADQSSILYVTVSVENMDRIKVDAENCSLFVRRCRGIDVVTPGDIAVRPVPPATGEFENAGAGVWKPSANDAACIWTIDRGETNTFAFVARVPWQPERPRACFLQADYRCKPGSFLGVKVHGAYTWRRDELYTFEDADSGGRLPKHEDRANHREDDADKLGNGESFTEDNDAEENGGD